MAAEPTSPYDMQLLRQQVSFARDELAETQRRQRALTVRSASSGIFIVPRPEDLEGTFLKQGQLVGYVMASGAPIVRAAVASEDIDLVRNDTRSVSVRIEGAMGPNPASSISLPASALNMMSSAIWRTALPKVDDASDSPADLIRSLNGSASSAKSGTRSRCASTSARAALTAA